MTIGEMLKKIRTKFKLTQKQVGDKCLMKDSQIRRYENGYSIPKISTLDSIVKSLLDNNSDQSHIFQYCIESNKKGKTEIYGNIHYIDLNADDEIIYFNIDKNEATTLTSDNVEEIECLEEKISNYKYERLKNALDYYVENKDKPTNLENSIIFMSKNLNVCGQQKAIDYMEDLAQIDKYKK
ncbi:helix-turn-helix domain-containing protein [Holdemanella porci]|uniref:helix-turn-helix domain-containing protein n=1 Tax=Holdemanella porci TaxID=2652276 RepID=UPI003F921BEA